MEKDFSELSCLAIKSPEVHDKINTPLYIFENNKHQTLFFCGQFAYVCVLPLHETLLYSMASAYIFEWLFTIIAVQKCKRPSGFTHLSVPSHSPGTSAQTLLSFDISLSACERTGAINPGRFLAAVRFCTCWLCPSRCPPQERPQWLEAGPWGLRSVPPAIWQCHVQRQLCQVSSLFRGETCAYVLLAVHIFQITQ